MARADSPDVTGQEWDAGALVIGRGGYTDGGCESDASQSLHHEDPCLAARMGNVLVA